MVAVPAVGGMSQQLPYLHPHEIKGTEIDLEPLLFSEVFSLRGPGPHWLGQAVGTMQAVGSALALGLNQSGVKYRLSY